MGSCAALRARRHLRCHEHEVRSARIGEICFPGFDIFVIGGEWITRGIYFFMGGRFTKILSSGIGWILMVYLFCNFKNKCLIFIYNFSIHQIIDFLILIYLIYHYYYRILIFLQYIYYHQIYQILIFHRIFLM